MEEQKEKLLQKLAPLFLDNFLVEIDLAFSKSDDILCNFRYLMWMWIFLSFIGQRIQMANFNRKRQADECQGQES